MEKPVLSPKGRWLVAVELKRLLRRHVGGRLSHFELILHYADVSGLREATPPLRGTIGRRSRVDGPTTGCLDDDDIVPSLAR